MYDILIRTGRLICPATQRDGPGAIAINGDRIVASGNQVSGESRTVLDFPDAVVLPGLVDLHAHPDRGSSKYGVDPDVQFLPRGTTTVLSQGDAGAANWPEYQMSVIRQSQSRVRLAINLASPGETKSCGCFEDPRDIDVDACVRAILTGGDEIWGIAVNISTIACGLTSPRWVLEQAVRAAELAERPLLFGARRVVSDFPLAKQLECLRPGDVVTYCFHPSAEGVVEHGRVRDCVWQARERGVLFDSGHGMTSFDFGVAEAAISQGFFPDTISTDGYRRHSGVLPIHDLPRTLSKLIAAGLSEADAFARVTVRPAEILGLAGEVGTLAVGACADLAILNWNPAAMPLCDVSGSVRPGGCWEPLLTIRGGRIFKPEQEVTR